MVEADAVLARIARIEALDPAVVTQPVLLGELRALIREAEDWARSEGDARADAAVSKLREEAEGMR
jgi:hypothetical protein